MLEEHSKELLGQQKLVVVTKSQKSNRKLSRVSSGGRRGQIEALLESWIQLETKQAAIWETIRKVNLLVSEHSQVTSPGGGRLSVTAPMPPGVAEALPPFHYEVRDSLKAVLSSQAPLSGPGGLPELLMRLLPFLRGLLTPYGERLLELASAVKHAQLAIDAEVITTSPTASAPPQVMTSTTGGPPSSTANSAISWWNSSASRSKSSHKVAPGLPMPSPSSHNDEVTNDGLAQQETLTEQRSHAITERLTQRLSEASVVPLPTGVPPSVRRVSSPIERSANMAPANDDSNDQRNRRSSFPGVIRRRSIRKSEMQPSSAMPLRKALAAAGVQLATLKQDIFRPLEALEERRTFIGALLRLGGYVDEVVAAINRDAKASQVMDTSTSSTASSNKSVRFFRWSDTDIGLLQAADEELLKASRAMDVCVHPLRGTFSLHARLMRAGFSVVPKSVAAPRRELKRCGILGLAPRGPIGQLRKNIFGSISEANTCLVALLVESDVTVYLAYGLQLTEKQRKALEENTMTNNRQFNRSSSATEDGTGRNSERHSSSSATSQTDSLHRRSGPSNERKFDAPNVLLIHELLPSSCKREVAVLATLTATNPSLVGNSPRLQLSGKQSRLAFRAEEAGDAEAWRHDIETTLSRTRARRQSFCDSQPSSPRSMRSSNGPESMSSPKMPGFSRPESLRKIPDAPTTPRSPRSRMFPSSSIRGFKRQESRHDGGNADAP